MYMTAHLDNEHALYITSFFLLILKYSYQTSNNDNLKKAPFMAFLFSGRLNSTWTTYSLGFDIFNVEYVVADMLRRVNDEKLELDVSNSKKEKYGQIF